MAMLSFQKWTSELKDVSRIQEDSEDFHLINADEGKYISSISFVSHLVHFYLEFHFPNKKIKLAHNRALRGFKATLKLDSSCSTVLPYLVEVRIIYSISIILLY
jgi:hypothetical protein